ncbi:MAG: DUF1206 domain-containing protein [Microbacterium sp.]|uniref:DUF1206 domain-containing protein n=1 Tax=Microbacterium sp. TaxID=51671 RepID=UPI0039E5DF25
MTGSARQAVREVRSSPVARGIARAGYAATGIVHLLVGVIGLVVAFGGEAESDQSGALRAIAAVPLGFAAVWVLAGALWALGLWHASSAFLVRGHDARSRWGVRLSESGQALAFLALGTIAAAIALGARPDGDQTAQDTSRGILSLPAGALLLGAVGLGIGVAGVVFAGIGITRGFRKRVAVPAGAGGRALTVLGVVGYVAKGTALVIVGILLVVAAVTVDADAAGGIDGALDALRAMAFGPALVALISAGFIAYGLFCIARARFARL